MRKNIYKTGLFTALIAISSCNLTQNSTEEKTVIKEISTSVESAKVSEASVKSSMEYLASNELRGRETGTEGIEKAAVYIEEKFNEAGLKPYFKTYRDSFEVRGLNGYNVVGFLEGNDPELKKEFVILGAHYDHVGFEKKVDGDSIANGANDNAAGTVAVLELAKHFGAAKNNKRSMLFILFSAEEMGLQGAKHISSRLKSEGLDLYSLVNFEMIGVPMTNNDYLAYLTGYENSNMADKFNEYANSKVLGFLPQAKEYSLFQRSDNYPFYLEFQVPSQTISTFDFTNYKYYHHVSDEASRMNYPHMVNLIEKVIPGISGIVNSAGREIKMNE
ncbi:M20/M25/M40 family metallo-hydrolase [Antarcticibacterium arcticum]|uniref:M20/M25/M40 family metallo-hydrolase n=1 Tax=Antarcticibacterium arcticum TaxID=2585771 RepID=A0A5B8YMT8_9FLAO|nr:M20/M25/M40 family metallo-hydrolase [Antarcticibacterium arcticum]QED38821.1 M20/M25/M40 family metallo-hydrolase [Antarcticibacterium arcticum]